MKKPLSKAATTAQHEIELVRKRHEPRQARNAEASGRAAAGKREGEGGEGPRERSRFT